MTKDQLRQKLAANNDLLAQFNFEIEERKAIMTEHIAFSEKLTESEKKVDAKYKALATDDVLRNWVR